MQTTTNGRKAKPKSFVCLECGKRLTAKAAQRAVNHGCPSCGGVDIDLAVQS